MTDWTARIVVSLELALGVWLLLHVRIVAGLWVSIGLLTLFSIYLMVLLATSGDQECACLGTQSHQLASSGLWKNVLLTGIAALGLVAARRTAEPPPVASGMS
jgi:hypothetical protein